MTTHPTPEQVSAALDDGMEIAVDMKECPDAHRNIDLCGQVLVAALATLRAHIERQDAVIEDLRQAASVACIGYELPGLASALRRTAR